MYVRAVYKDHATVYRGLLYNMIHLNILPCQEGRAVVVNHGKFNGHVGNDSTPVETTMGR